MSITATGAALGHGGNLTSLKKIGGLSGHAITFLRSDCDGTGLYYYLDTLSQVGSLSMRLMIIKL